MMSARPARIIFAGGGTGGHLFPALAIASRVTELLRDNVGAEIVLVGTRRGLEFRMRSELGYPLHLINVRGLARSLSLQNLIVPFVLIGALIKSWRLLGRFRPDLVVGTGGYVSWPVLKTANWKSIPTVLQEQNSFPGITTRQFAVAARRVYLGFARAQKYLKTNETRVTGNPVRLDISKGDRSAAFEEYGLDASKKTILILGGSQGAQSINRAVLKSLAAGSLPAGYQLLWQTGKRDHTDVTAAAGRTVADCTLFPFAHNMADVYAAADLAVARAGALTLAELTVCGIPSLLVPYPQAAGDHQRHNAADMVARGLAHSIDDAELGNRDLLAEAVMLMESDEYGRMKENLKEAGREGRQATDVIARDIIGLINEQRRK